MKLRPMTHDEILAMVAAGYHCEVREADDCAYRPAPHFTPEGYACDACKPFTSAFAADVRPKAEPDAEHRYNFPELKL